MATRGDKLGRKAELAIAALLGEPTVEKASLKCGVSYRALKDWLTRPDFMAAYRDARRAAPDPAGGDRQGAASGAAPARPRNLTPPAPGARSRRAGRTFNSPPRGRSRLTCTEDW